MFYVTASDGNLYGFGKYGKIYKRNIDAYWIQVYDQQSPIRGACEKPSYGGKIYLEWATRTELHRKEIPGDPTWNDVDAAGTVQGDTFPKTNLNDVDWHTMAQVGGAVMIANGNTLAMSAYDDSYTNEALDMVPGNYAKTIIERDGQSIIGCYRQAEPNKGVNGQVDTEIPLIQAGDDGGIYFADFVNSIPLKRFPGGGIVNPGGMINMITGINIFSWEQDALSWIDKQTIGNMALMGVFNAEIGKGGIFTYGRRFLNHPRTLNLEYQFDADEIGAVVCYNGTILFSFNDGGDYGVMAVDPNNKAIGIYEGLDYKAPQKLPAEITQWKSVEMFMKALPSGASVEFWYRLNKDGEFIQAKTMDGFDQYDKAGGKKAVFRISAEGEIFEPRVRIIPVGNESPEIYRIRAFFV